MKMRSWSLESPVDLNANDAISSSGLSFGMNGASPSIAMSGPGSYGWNTLGMAPAAPSPSSSTNTAPSSAVQGATQTVGPATAAAQTDISSMQGATNLSPITVNGYTASMPSIGSIAMPSFGSSGTGVGGPSIGAPNTQLHVSNLAPVHVSAQMPMQPSMYDTLNMMANDHPVIAGAIGSITNLAPVFSIAHTIWNAQHGLSPIASLLQNIPGASGLLSHLGGSGSGQVAQPSSSVIPNPMNMQSISGISSGMGGSSISTGSPLPSYIGLGALAGIGDAPIGGYWNQQALKMASPAYGPYAGYGGATPQPINYANPYAPSGITSAGY